jgi:hypothetical protein
LAHQWFGNLGKCGWKIYAAFENIIFLSCHRLLGAKANLLYSKKGTISLYLLGAWSKIWKGYSFKMTFHLLLVTLNWWAQTWLNEGNNIPITNQHNFEKNSFFIRKNRPT